MRDNPIGLVVRKAGLVGHGFPDFRLVQVKPRQIPARSSDHLTRDINADRVPTRTNLLTQDRQIESPTAA